MTRSSYDQSPPTSVMSTIEAYIREELLRAKSATLTESTPLIEAGYITSLQAVELALFLEERFQVEIPPEEVTEAAFQNLRTLTNLVQEKLAGTS